MINSITEVRPIIDEFESRLEQYTTKPGWQKSSLELWQNFLVIEGPKIIDSWRELAGLISLLPEDELNKVIVKWDQILQLLNSEETLFLALKHRKKNFTEEEIPEPYAAPPELPEAPL